MKAALAKTPKHDFVLPSEVHRVTLCSTMQPEVFLDGTEPARVCGDGTTPPPEPLQRRRHHHVAAAADDAPAPAPVSTP